MTTIVERDRALADLLAAVATDRVTTLESVDNLEEHLQRNPDEYAVVLGPSVDDRTAVAVAEHNRVVRPALGVILLRATVDSAVLAEALRSGMREVVSSGDRQGLERALDRASTVAHAMLESTGPRHAGAADHVGRLVTVFATKGGVGKSLVATNLAVALADLGRRVCVVDLDVSGGDVALMLQLSPQHTLADLPTISGDLDASGVASLLVEHSERLSVLAAPVHLGAPVPVEPIGALLDALKGMFDVVVVDTSGAFDDLALHALDHSDLLLLVGTLDIPSLKSLKLASGTLDLLNLPRDRWRLLLNRADPKVGLSVAEFEETLGMSTSATLPTSRDVLAAVNRGETIVRSQRGHQVSKTFVSLAEAITRDIDPSAAHLPAGTSRRGGARRLRAKKVG